MEHVWIDDIATGQVICQNCKITRDTGNNDQSALCEPEDLYAEEEPAEEEPA